MLTVLVSTISNSQVFWLKNVKRYSHFFSKNISIYAIFNQSFNDTLTNEIVGFEQLSPGCELCLLPKNDCFPLEAMYKHFEVYTYCIMPTCYPASSQCI